MLSWNFLFSKIIEINDNKNKNKTRNINKREGNI